MGDIGVYSTRSLDARGLRRADLRRAVESGALHRVRRGWYAVPNARPEIVAAARIGGRLTCLDALRHHGVWSLPSGGLHVRVSSGVSLGRVAAGVHIHWRPERLEPGLDDPAEALRMAASCVDLRQLVIAADSVANSRVLSPSQLRDVLDATPRGRRARALHDPAAESGIETMLRLALRRHRLHVRSQVNIPGVGRVDFVIGQRLVVEADGFEWHGGRDAFERDRSRDRELVRRGHVVLRSSYRQIVDDLDLVVRAILDVVRRRDHLWRAVHRAQLSESGYFVDL